MRNYLVIRKCSNCGKDVEIYHKQRLNKKNIFCSRKCCSEYNKKERESNNEYFNCECPICKKKFHLCEARIKKNKNHYCSRKCHNRAKKEYMKGENNHQYGLKGDKNVSWKSDRRISPYGYILVRVPDHPFRMYDDFVFEHRLIAEQYLLNDTNSIVINGKKYLKPELDVHHIDHNKKNNDPSNLKIMTKSEHSFLHVKELCEKQKRKVCKFDLNGNFIQFYDSIKDAADDNNILSQNIQHICKKGKGSAGGFIWKYKMRGFEKISKLTNVDFNLPKRATNGSAGYDFYLYENVKIEPGINCIRTGVKSYMNTDEVLLLYIRSSLAYKYNLTLANSVAVIDSSFYNSDENEGEICLLIYNPTQVTLSFNKDDRIAQGIFMKYLTVDDEISPDTVRSGGFGSTGK